MKYIPIGSKQIAYVQYDGQSSLMHIQYHTGQTKVCVGIDETLVQKLIHSSNAYDMIMRLLELPQSSPSLSTDRSELHNKPLPQPSLP